MSLLRWDSGKEFDDQYVNYQVKKRQFRVDGSKTLATSMQMLMDHINSNHALHAEVHWGTLRLHHQLGVPLHSSYYIWQILSVFHIYVGSSFPWYRSPNSDAIIYSATTLTRWGKNRKRRQRTRSDCSRGLSHFLIISLLPHTNTNIQNRYKYTNTITDTNANTNTGQGWMVSNVLSYQFLLIRCNREAICGRHK